MERLLDHDLDAWLRSPRRKPLVVRGARQVGKTWTVRALAARSGRRLVELNFERTPEARELFEPADPAEVLRRVEVFTATRIRAGEALVFLDEIQAAPTALARLRWFAEELPELPVVAAGSLLEFVLADHSFSMPVGRITYLHLEPMSFSEFLRGTGREPLWAAAAEARIDAPLAPVFHRRLSEAFSEYLLVGGLPEAVTTWRESRSHVEVSRVHSDLLATYRDDFPRYSGRVPTDRLERVLRAVPQQLGRRFKYSAADRESRAADLGRALDLVCHARLCHRVVATDGTGVPLGATVRERWFKVIQLDVGLVSSLLGLSPLALPDVAAVFANRGPLAEQAAGQALRVAEPAFREPRLHCWSRERKGAAAELDYLVEHRGRVVPVEVKAGATGSLKSLHMFMGLRGLEVAARLNSDPPSVAAVDVRTSTGDPVRYRLLSLPLYLAERLPAWLDEVS